VKQISTLTVGIDLGDQYSQICILDEEGEIVEEGKLRTTAETFAERFGGRTPCLVVMEASTHSPWLSRLIEELGHECLVAHPASLYSGRRRKTDRIDAEKLARWARTDRNVLSPVHHPSAEIQADMALIHSRRSLVETRTKLINRCRGLVKSRGQRLPRCDAASFPTKVRGFFPEALAPAIEPLLRAITVVNEEIKAMDEAVKELAETRYGESTRLLEQVPGVGTLTALTFALTIRAPERFYRSRQVGAYLGLTPGKKQSGESDPELAITKTGNVYLRVLLVQCAQHVLARGPDSDLKRWGLARAAAGKAAKRRAIVAMARKLAVLLHHLWKTGAVYEPLRKEVEQTLPSVPRA
jgi:transposase